MIPVSLQTSELPCTYQGDVVVLQLVTATLPLVTVFQLFTGLGTSIGGALREFGNSVSGLVRCGGILDF